MSTAVSLLLSRLESTDGLKVQTAFLVLRLSSMHYRLGESVFSGLWLRWQLATGHKKILDKCLQCVCLIILFSFTID